MLSHALSIIKNKGDGVNQNNSVEDEKSSDEYGSYSNNDISGSGVPYGVKIPGKRRSKNDNWGRDFNCKYCDK